MRSASVAWMAVLWSCLAGPASAQEAPRRLVNASTPPPDCTFHVNFDRNGDLPGYRVEQGSRTSCLPFMPTNQLVPTDYQGADFYVAEFTDARIRQRWAACRADTACAERARSGANPFVAFEPRRTGSVDPEGRVDQDGEVDLRAIRRPAFFGRGPFREAIANAEAKTLTVEFTVPRDSYERLHLRREDPIKLRGWYLEGDGVDDGAGRRVRALVIMNNGGGSELTATDDPEVSGVVRDPVTRRYAVQANAYGKGEQPGMRHWRGFLASLQAGGFDVLVTDRRGNGISGGVSGFNTAEQARDIFRELDQLQSGEGLRLLTPDGRVLSGAEAGGRLLAGQRADSIPVVIGGYSRGSYATAWAMHQNFVADCDRDRPDGGCRPPLGRGNIRGAILYGPNSAGLGYRVSGHDMIEAVLREERNTTYYPDGDVFANVGQWPGLLIVKGTWDYVEGLEGSLDAFRRAREPKEIFVFRGPHALQTQAEQNMGLAGERMVAFAKAVVLGRPRVEGASPPVNLRELVASSPDHWELTTAPRD